MALVDHNGEAEFPVSKDKVFDAICIAIPTIKGLSIASSDKFSGRILVKGGISLASWGENVPIQLTEITENRTRVSIISTPKTGIMFGGANDMGKNRKNIEQILLTTSQILQSGQVSQVSQKTPVAVSPMLPVKKKMSLGKKILLGLGVLIAIGIIAHIGKGESDASITTATQTTGATMPKQWTEVISLKGSGMKKSASFHLSGGKARIKYTFETNLGVFAFYVVPEGDDVMQDGGIPEVMIQQSEASETYLTKTEGNYYLNINSSGGNWTVVVEEEK